MQESLFYAPVDSTGAEISATAQRLLTPAACLQAVQEDGLLLKNVPPEWRDAAVCDAAVANNPMALAAVPVSLIHEGMIKTAVDQNAEVLHLVPQSFLTPALCAAAVKRDGSVIRQVPDHLITTEMLLDAVTQSGLHLRWVSHHPKTLDAKVIAAALDNAPCAYAHLPAQAMNSVSVIRYAVSKGGEALQFVPAQLKTAEICARAMQSNPYALRFVPTSIKTYRFYREWCLNDETAVLYLLRLQDLTVPAAKAIVSVRPEAYDFLPDRLQTPQVASSIKKGEPKAAEAAPLQPPSEEFSF